MAQLLIDLPSAYVRLALRAYFTALFLVLGFLGDRCCAQRAKLLLYRRRRVKITQMTGWLGGTNAALALTILRASPAGFLGVAMIFASLLGITCDLAVSGLVVTTSVISRCPFNTTGPYTVLTVTPFSNVYTEVPSAGGTYNLITQAQATSQRNGGLDGIYRKVNTDLNFRAASEDIVGSWICDDPGVQRTFPGDLLPQNITTILQDDGLLFNETATAQYQENGDGNGTIITGNLFIWSASQGHLPTAPWSVRAAVEIPNNSSTSSAEKQIKIYVCNLNATSIEWLLEWMYVDVALLNWVSVVQGDLYPVNVPNSEDVQTGQGLVIASNLNNIMMNFGRAWGGPTNPFTITDPTQGCLATRAQVPWAVLTLFGIVTVGTIAMGIYWVVLTILVRLARARSPAAYVNAIEDYTPNGLITWMLQATNLVGVGKQVSCAGLKQWFLGPDPQQQTVRLQTFEEDDERAGSVDIQVDKKGMAATSTTPVEVQPKLSVRPVHTL
jgi:hypothetical protein